MKRILYLSFYFEPDLCAGSFRNSPLLKELADQLKEDTEIDVITTLPNRYKSFDATAPAFEQRDNVTITRVIIPKHKSGFADQINSFKTYFFAANKFIEGKKYDLVFASSSRLFTAYLGYTIAKRLKVPLYLDIRDIFTDTMKDVLTNPILKASVLPILRRIERKVFSYASHINLISGGFRTYFEKYKKPAYSYFSNGIDSEFLSLPPSAPKTDRIRLITYAGNIGEGQGLHKIVPQAAKSLGDGYKFLIIGDGGAKQKLLKGLEDEKVNNVEIRDPVSRKRLLQLYHESDFLFLHLNDYAAFEKVLPSKIFELGSYDKPIIAGVGGFANKFIDENIPNRILFLPGQVGEMVDQLKKYQYHTGFRDTFLKAFRRDEINKRMAESIASYLL